MQHTQAEQRARLDCDIQLRAGSQQELMEAGRKAPSEGLGKLGTNMENGKVAFLTRGPA